jgi:hypothetical protein
MIIRIILTAAALAAYSMWRTVFNPLSTLILGEAAGQQLLNSDAAAVTTSMTFGAMGGLGYLSILLLLAALVAIWYGTVKRLITAISTVSMLSLALLALPTDRAWAFADTADKTEAYTILPNQSAFWVPDTGANKDTQAQFESESYYNERKVASKRFVVPHAKLGGTGGFLGWDFYVPTGRLYIVDRTPYSREWVAQSNRGTSNKDESFPCQSKEGLNIRAGVSIGTSVTEDNAAKFLYNFGVTPPKGSPSDPQVIFTSVYYGRSLSDVMDDVGRKKVQTLVCNEIGKRTFDEANADMVKEMDAIEKTTKEYFASVGVTLNFIGWADTFTFDHEIQAAVNRKYEADKLAQAIPILQQVATIKVQEGMGKGMETHGLPIVVTPGMIEALMRLAPTMAVAAPLAPAAK